MTVEEEIELTASCSYVYGYGDCRESNYCWGRGNCSDMGLCDCLPGYSGMDCSIEVPCMYWSETNNSWSSEGCYFVPPPGPPDGLLHCECDHLTDFGGIGIPTSPADLLAELTSINFVTFSLDDMANALASFSFAANPAAFLLVTIVTFLNIASVIFANFRLHRRILMKAREMRAARRAKRAENKSKVAKSKTKFRKGKDMPKEKADELEKTKKPGLATPAPLKPKTEAEFLAAARANVAAGAVAGVGPAVGVRVHDPPATPTTPLRKDAGPVEGTPRTGKGKAKAKQEDKLSLKRKGKVDEDEVTPRKQTPREEKDELEKDEEGEGEGEEEEYDPASVNENALQSRLRLNWSEAPAYPALPEPKMSPRVESTALAIPEPPQLTSAAMRARELRAKYAQQRSGMDRFRLATLSAEGGEAESGTINRGALQDRISAVQLERPVDTSGSMLQDRVPMLTYEDSAPRPGAKTPRSARQVQRGVSDISKARSDTAVAKHLARIRGQTAGSGLTLQLSEQERLVLAARRRALLRTGQGEALANFAARQDRISAPPAGAGASPPSSQPGSARLPPSPPASPPEQPEPEPATGKTVAGAKQDRLSASMLASSSLKPPTASTTPSSGKAPLRVCKLTKGSSTVGSSALALQRPAESPDSVRARSTACFSTPTSKESLALVKMMNKEKRTKRIEAGLPPEEPPPPEEKPAPVGGGLAALMAARRQAEGGAGLGAGGGKGLAALMGAADDATSGKKAAGFNWKCGAAAATANKSLAHLVKAAQEEQKRQERTRAAKVLLKIKGAAQERGQALLNPAASAFKGQMEAGAVKRRRMSKAAKEGRFLDVGKEIVGPPAKYAKRKTKEFWSGLRSDHAIISFLYPHDEETEVISDPQVAQIFWNMLMMENMVLALLSDNDEGPLISIKMIILAMIAAGMCVAAGMFCRLVFRWGNKGKRFKKRTKEKKAAIKDLYGDSGTADAAGKASMIDGLSDAERMKIAFKKAREAKKVKRSWREIRDTARICIAWFINIAFYLAVTMIVITYAMMFGKEETKAWLMSWVLASGNAWLVMEPFEVLVLVMLPFLFENDTVQSCKENAKELGLI